MKPLALPVRTVVGSTFLHRRVSMLQVVTVVLNRVPWFPFVVPVVVSSLVESPCNLDARLCMKTTWILARIRTQERSPIVTKLLPSAILGSTLSMHLGSA